MCDDGRRTMSRISIHKQSRPITIDTRASSSSLADAQRFQVVSLKLIHSFDQSLLSSSFIRHHNLIEFDLNLMKLPVQQGSFVGVDAGGWEFFFVFFPHIYIEFSCRQSRTKQQKKKTLDSTTPLLLPLCCRLKLELGCMTRKSRCQIVTSFLSRVCFT